MIIQVNFISKEYKSKLMMQQLSKLSGVLVVLILGVILGGGYYVDTLIQAKQTETENVKKQIAAKQAEIAKIQAEKKGIPDLSSKINMLQDLFAQKNLRFSEVIYNLMQNTPSKMWFSDFTYKDNRLFLKGIAMDELSIYTLERNLKETGFFDSVTQDYIREAEVNKNFVREFQYNGVMKPLAALPTAGTPAAITTATAVTAASVKK